MEVRGQLAARRPRFWVVDADAPFRTANARPRSHAVGPRQRKPHAAVDQSAPATARLNAARTSHAADPRSKHHVVVDLHQLLLASVDVVSVAATVEERDQLAARRPRFWVVDADAPFRTANARPRSHAVGPRQRKPHAAVDQTAPATARLNAARTSHAADLLKRRPAVADQTAVAMAKPNAAKTSRAALLPRARKAAVVERRALKTLR